MFELSLLIILLFVVSSIVYTSVKIGISPMPSSLKAHSVIIESIEKFPNSNVVDVGSGFGFLAIRIASSYPNRNVVGYEISFFPWLISVCFKYLFGYKNLDFYRKNFLNITFESNSTFVCYLFPDGMKLLEDKLKKEKVEVNLLISNTFSFINRKPHKTIYLDDIYKTPIYFY